MEIDPRLTLGLYVRYDPDAAEARAKSDWALAIAIFTRKSLIEQAKVYKIALEDGVDPAGTLQRITTNLTICDSDFGVFDSTGKNSVTEGTKALAQAYKTGACKAIVELCAWLTSETDNSMIPRGGMLETHVYPMLEDAGEDVEILGDKYIIFPAIVRICDMEGTPELAASFAALEKKPVMETFAAALGKIAERNASPISRRIFPGSGLG